MAAAPTRAAGTRRTWYLLLLLVPLAIYTFAVLGNSWRAMARAHLQRGARPAALQRPRRPAQTGAPVSSAGLAHAAAAVLLPADMLRTDARPAPAALPLPTDAPGSVRGIQLVCGDHGVIRLYLRAEWSNMSAVFAEQLAQPTSRNSSTIYRLEPGFLIQGRFASPGVSPRIRLSKAPKVMERGEVGWAGGSTGPDFFIYMGDGPAGWLGNPHDGMIWAEVADEPSMEVARVVSLLPVPPTRPGQMHTLATPLPIGVAPWRPEARPASAPSALSGVSILKVRGAALDTSAADCPEECHALAHTELHGTVVGAGDRLLVDSARECCAQCAQHAAREGGKPGARPCNVWVWCGSAARCAKQHRQCWLKHHPDIWGAAVTVGTSDRWTTGTAQRAPANHSSGAGVARPTAADAHIALVSPAGPAGEVPGQAGGLRLRLRLRAAGAERARTRVETVLARHAVGGAGCGTGAAADGCVPAALAWARPPPPLWGSEQAADGQGPSDRWPIGHALVLGTLGSAAEPPPAATPAASEWPQVPVRRGSVGWWAPSGARTADGPWFFIALADMPHLGMSAVVWADVAEEDLPALDRLALDAAAGRTALPLPIRAVRAESSAASDELF